MWLTGDLIYQLRQLPVAQKADPPNIADFAICYKNLGINQDVAHADIAV